MIEDKEFLNLLNKIKQIEDVARSLSYLNFGKVDSVETPFTNFISEFSERNKNLIHTIIFMITKKIEVSTNYTNDIDTEGIKLLIIFALRDIIENIEVLSWLKLNNNQWFNNSGLDNIIIDDKTDLSIFIEYINKNIDNEKYSNFIKKLSGEENMKSYKISKLGKTNLESEIEKKYDEINLSKDFKYIEDIKKELHNYIHKNGLKYINLSGISYEQFLKEYMNRIVCVFKFYFKISFLLDGTCVGSSDYIDYLDCGEQPPEDCQYWVAPIFDEYIFNQFDENDKEWLKNNNNYNMQFAFLKNK